jgi:trehalose 6-phosphate synthase
VPVHYIFRSVDRLELLSLYRAADVALVTPLKDGMNLVAKEYCACQVAEDGVLLLSEFAGAAAQLHPEAVLVNPHDVEEVAAGIAAACSMPPQEKRRRMKTLRRKIQKSDIYWWVDSFLGAVFAHDLRDFAPVEGGGAAGAAAPPAAASADGEAQPFIESLSSYRQLPAGGE